MPEHYDVIVIGSGAGGGAVAHTLAPSGKRILILERGNFLPRETANWDVEAVFDRQPVHLRGHLVRRRRPRRSSRRSTTSSGAPPSSTARRSTGCARRTSRTSPTSTACRRRGRSAMTSFEPWYTRAEWLYQVHGNHGEDPTEGPWSQAVPLARGVARAPDRADLRRPAARRLPPVPRAVRHPPGRGRPRPQHLHPLHLVRRLPVPRPRQGGRRDDRRSGRCWTSRTSPCWSTPRCCGSRPTGPAAR